VRKPDCPAIIGLRLAFSEAEIVISNYYLVTVLTNEVDASGWHRPVFDDIAQTPNFVNIVESVKGSFQSTIVGVDISND
jgi:hypothetical protein